MQKLIQYVREKIASMLSHDNNYQQSTETLLFYTHHAISGNRNPQEISEIRDTIVKSMDFIDKSNILYQEFMKLHDITLSSIDTKQNMEFTRNYWQDKINAIDNHQINQVRD